MPSWVDARFWERHCAPHQSIFQQPVHSPDPVQDKNSLWVVFFSKELPAHSAGWKRVEKRTRRVSGKHPDTKLRSFCWHARGMKKALPSILRAGGTNPERWGEIHATEKSQPPATNERQFIVSSFCRTISSFQSVESASFFP